MSGRTGIWGNKNEWDKKKYDPEKWGKFIFYNYTFGDPITPNGQDVTLTVGSKQIKLAPGEKYEYQTKKDELLRVKAKSQLSNAGMKSAEIVIRNTRLLDDHHWWIESHASRSPMHLAFHDGTRPAPPYAKRSGGPRS
jgi:hypothetical protein